MTIFPLLRLISTRVQYQYIVQAGVGMSTSKNVEKCVSEFNGGDDEFEIIEIECKDKKVDSNVFAHPRFSLPAISSTVFKYPNRLSPIVLRHIMKSCGVEMCDDEFNALVHKHYNNPEQKNGHMHSNLNSNLNDVNSTFCTIEQTLKMNCNEHHFSSPPSPSQPS